MGKVLEVCFLEETVSFYGRPLEAYPNILLSLLAYFFVVSMLVHKKLKNSERLPIVGGDVEGKVPLLNLLIACTKK